MLHSLKNTLHILHLTLNERPRPTYRLSFLFYCKTGATPSENFNKYLFVCVILCFYALFTISYLFVDKYIIDVKRCNDRQRRATIYYTKMYVCIFTHT